MKNLSEIGNALVAFHVKKACWGSKQEVSYEYDVKSFKELISRFYTDYYGAGLYYLNNMNEDESECLPDEEWTLKDGAGNIVLTGRSEIESETGTLNIDGEYDTWYVKRLSECDESELELIYNEGYHHTLDESDLLAYCCDGLGWKMIESVDLGDKSCDVQFTDGTKDIITFNEDKDVWDTIDDFFTDNDIDNRSRDKWFGEIEWKYS